MTQPNGLVATVQDQEPNAQKLSLHRERNRRYRQQHPDNVHASVQRYVASDAGKAARQRANARSKAWGNTIRFLNRETPEAIAQQFPFLTPHIETIARLRPLSRRSIREVLPADSLERLRQTSFNCVSYL